MVLARFSLTFISSYLLLESTAACVPTVGLGCLNGQAFNRSTEFVCGASVCDASYQNCQPAIYQWASSSCCAQGIAFDKENSFCCYEGVHDNSVGVCKPYTPNFPTTCGCYDVERRLSGVQGSPQIGNDPNIVNTKVAADQPCSGPLPTEGCLNGYLYDYSTQMPCGDYLVNVQSHGCCTTAEGIKPYNLQTQSCCKLGVSNEVLEGPRACTCSKCTTTSTTSTTTSTTTTTLTTTRNAANLEVTTPDSPTSATTFLSSSTFLSGVVASTLSTTLMSDMEESTRLVSTTIFSGTDVYATPASTTFLSIADGSKSNASAIGGSVVTGGSTTVLLEEGEQESMSGTRATFASSIPFIFVALLTCTE